MIDNEFNLSNNGKRNVRIVGGKDLIMLTGFPDDLYCDFSMVSLVAPDGAITNEQKIEKTNGTMAYPLQHVPAGRYELKVMRKEKPTSSWYVGWINHVTVAIGRDRIVKFEKSMVYDDNLHFFGKLKADRSTIERYSTMPRGDNIEIIKKAYEITRNCFIDYLKALAIHDWIADNIYYDYDSYNGHNIDYSKLGKAGAVFRNKLAVCAGYSDLAVVMLRAVGIPAYSVSCFALGRSTCGVWTKSNVNHSSNHAVTMAYLQRRWVIMDITWDSGNKFENGRFQHTNDTEHRYFDPTLQNFSNTHKFCA